MTIKKSCKIITLEHPQKIKKFLLAHGLRAKNLKEPTITNDITGLYEDKFFKKIF